MSTAVPRYRQVIVICSDEHDPRHSGFGGSAMVRTPNLDRLAARATRFQNAWTPSPICVPARASMATGMWVHQHRCWDNALAYHGQFPSWGHRLQQAGVPVESIGKLHYRSAADDTGFDRQQEAAHIAGAGQVWGCVRDPLPLKDQGGAGLFSKIGAGESNYNRFDRRVAEKAVEWVRGRAAAVVSDTKPAALFVGFVAPHFPLVVPQEYLDLYPLAQVPWPKLRPETGYVRHPWVERQSQFNGLDGQLETEERKRLAIASYLALVSFLDEQVGRILDAIDDAGLGEDTLVIYLSDHGDNLGARGMWNKSLLYRESTGIPLMMAGRGVPQRVNSTHVGLVDLFPTVLQALGVPSDPADAKLPGKSLLELAEREDEARIGFSEYHAIGAPTAAFMLVRGHYKYHYYVGYEPELFDLREDPEETHSLHASARHREVLAQCEAELRRMLDPEAVDRQAKHDQNLFVEQHGGREAVLAMKRVGATPVPQ